MSRSPNQPNRSLFIRFVSFETRPQELRGVFSRYGEVKDVYIPRDYYTRKPRGFAYVEFENLRDAEEAFRNSGEILFQGKRLEVEYAQGDRKTPNEMRGRPSTGNNDWEDDKRRRRSLSFERRPSRRHERVRSRSRSKTRYRWNSPPRRSRSRSGSRVGRRRSFSPENTRRGGNFGGWTSNRGDEHEGRFGGARFRRNDSMSGNNFNRRY